MKFEIIVIFNDRKKMFNLTVPCPSSCTSLRPLAVYVVSLFSSFRGLWQIVFAAMLSGSCRLSQNPTFSSLFPNSSISNPDFPSLRFSTLKRSLSLHLQLKFSASTLMAFNSKLSNGVISNEHELNRFVEVGNKIADAAGEVIRKYFRKKFDIIDKDDLSK